MIKEKAFLLADKLEGRGYRQAGGRLRTGPIRFPRRKSGLLGLSTVDILMIMKGTLFQKQ
jgi:hypothetical protein